MQAAEKDQAQRKEILIQRREQLLRQIKNADENAEFHLGHLRGLKKELKLLEERIQEGVEQEAFENRFDLDEFH